MNVIRSYEISETSQRIQTCAYFQAQIINIESIARPPRYLSKVSPPCANLTTQVLQNLESNHPLTPAPRLVRAVYDALLPFLGSCIPAPLATLMV